MKDYRFKARRLDNGEWVEGGLAEFKDDYYENYSIIVTLSLKSDPIEFDTGGMETHVDYIYVDPSTVELIGEKEIKIKAVREFWEKMSKDNFKDCINNKTGEIVDDFLMDKAEKLIEEMGE